MLKKKNELGTPGSDTWQLLVMPRCAVDLLKGSQSLWAWFTVGMTEQSTVARGVYGGPCSPPFFSPLVHDAPGAPNYYPGSSPCFPARWRVRRR